jgi:hypothetical protein
MSSILTTPYLVPARDFPKEAEELSSTLNRTYVNIASAVNNKISGTFPINRPVVTAETWYISGNQKYQSLRQVYQVTSTSNVNLGFKLANSGGITRMYGTYTDSAGNWYGLPGGTSTAMAGLITFYLMVTADPKTDVIVFTLGAGAPTLASGFVIIEWLSAI